MDLGMIGMIVGGWFATCVVNKLAEKVSLHLDDQYDLLTGAKAMAEDVTARLPRIRAVIQAAEGRPIRDPALAAWLRQLKDAAYEADDLLDEFEFKELHDKLHSKSKVSDFVSPAVKLLKHFIMSDDDLKNLKNLAGNLEKIYLDINCMEEQLKDYNSQQRSVTRETSSIIQDIVVGRDTERDMILDMLLHLADEPESSIKSGTGSSSYPSVGVLPIVGIGGVGKTTLAQLIYNDERVARHFELRKWVYVSDNFDVKRISKELAYDSVLARISDDSSLDGILGKVKDATRNKRFLFVLDDVWDETGSKWRELRGVLTSGAKGSMVLVTTQSPVVAEVMGTMDPIELKSLQEDDYWILFEHCAFGEKNVEEERREKMQTIGRKISEKLHGLPLAGKVLGSLLNSKLDEDYWKMILESEWWEHEYVLDNILPSLALSYEHLNANLKQCFAYCSIFPRGYVLEKDRLVQMWMAQGFIQNKSRVRMRMEDIGGQIYDELTSRYFFLPTLNDKYVMHDLIRELAVFVSLDECLVISDEKGEIPETIRHLTLRTDKKMDAIMDTCRLQNLRSILFFGDNDSERFYSFLDSMLKQSKSLRVLDLSYSQVKLKKLPDAISGLSHLRYLDVSCTRIKQLPKSFGRLCHLQVLRMRSCHLKRLPEDMNKLINLRHLYGEADTISLITGIGDLIDLQELEEFRVTKKRRHEIGELKGLRNLRRRLAIKNLENVNSKEEAMEAMLKDKEHLTALNLIKNLDPRSLPDAETEIFEGLQPHPSLKELRIKGYGGTRFPTWMVESKFLTNIEFISLDYCVRLESLPPLGQLPFLKELHLANMPAVKRIGREFYGDTGVAFPSLEVLKFKDFKEWEEWLEADGAQFLPRLRIFDLQGCYKLRKVPLLFLSSSLVELHIGYWGDFGNALPGCLQSLTSLTDLQIVDYRAQVSLCLSNLSSLKHLELWDCPEMKLVGGGLQFLTTLERLELTRCPKLIESSEPVQLHEEQGLRTLNGLTIDDTVLLQNLWILLGSLPSLQRMHIRWCHGMTNFTREQELWFQQLTSLQDLEIYYCENVESLPTSLANFPSIRKLHILTCPKVTSLPGNGLSPSLEELHIGACPLLKDRCQRGGADWPKIAHIPFIRIDSETIQML
ncbi:putative disease resistance protein RGA4 [Phoenix dactylifera]|uniref:Disease resistance protein RGA4 n=1 Tax=Phoenix dactylifera TaxID=42345 RepID=A0A8B7MX30_PHODC|nr:putative disease resistance protein RGA4 [Phoenix dactylifera]